jgi:hypothetical protein
VAKRFSVVNRKKDKKKIKKTLWCVITEFIYLVS